jgi:Arc/MetJ family transcription regulator
LNSYTSDEEQQAPEMRTNIEMDDELMEEGMRRAKTKTKRETGSPAAADQVEPANGNSKASRKD